MKLLLLVIFVFAPRPFLSQEFKSSATAHSKTQYELEFIDRNIDISKDKIIITSTGKEVTDIQELTIQSIKQKEYDEMGLCTWFYCNSKGISGTEMLVIVPVQEKPEQIIIFEPLENGVNSREFRIILD